MFKTKLKTKYQLVVADFKTVSKKFLDQGQDKAAIEDLITKFKDAKTKNKIKETEHKNIDFWGKGKFEDFKSFVMELEGAKTKNQEKTEVKTEGTELVAENEGWKAYKIINHKACMLMGAGTKWCITQEKDDHWKNYSSRNTFYFIISKTLPKENPWYKIALQASAQGKKTYWDAEDKKHDSVPAELKIPDIEIEVPEFDLDELISSINREIANAEEYDLEGDGAADYEDYAKGDADWDRLDSYDKEQLEVLKSIDNNWEETIKDCLDVVYVTNMYTRTNEVGSASIGEREYELSTDLKEAVEALTPEQFSEVESGIDPTITKEGMVYVNHDGRFAAILDSTKLSETVKDFLNDRFEQDLEAGKSEMTENNIKPEDISDYELKDKRNPEEGWNLFFKDEAGDDQILMSIDFDDEDYISRLQTELKE